jgi:formylglycine-generating enzyme required for sulfatase activity
MYLSGQQRKELQSALIDAFPTAVSLEQMLVFELNKNLRAIAGEGSLQEIIFKLIQVANAEGWIENLVRAARNSNDGNQLLKTVAAGLMLMGDPETPPISSPNIPQTQVLKLEVFTFETVKLQLEEKKGFLGRSVNEVKLYRRPSHAKCFVEDLGHGVSLEMVEISGGTFTMGTSQKEEKSEDYERPRHQVTIKPFFMGKYPITQEQWEKVAAFCPRIDRDLDPRPSYFKGRDDLPVDSVSWDDAVEFCARLSKKTGRNYCLPTEAEWEYACRAGTTTPFYFGETITTEVANYKSNYTYGNGPTGEYREKTTPVGSFAPNAFGLYDMHGNVWEWCADYWHNDYNGAPTDGSAWLSDNRNEARLLRGGSWYFSPVGCRSAYRYWNDPVIDSSGIGFRVVCGGAAARTL